MRRQPQRDRSTRAEKHSPSDRLDGVADRRAALEDAFMEITIAYENAVAAADEGAIDFAPFDGLPAAIRILRAVLAEEARS